MRKNLAVLSFIGLLSVAACGNTQAEQTDLATAYNVAAAIEAAYASNPKANPAIVKQASALLSSAQAALIAWQSAPSGSTTESVALAAAIAALVAFEAQMSQSAAATHAALDCNVVNSDCGRGDGHRASGIVLATTCNWFIPVCSDGVHRG